MDARSAFRKISRVALAFAALTAPSWVLLACDEPADQALAEDAVPPEKAAVKAPSQATEAQPNAEKPVEATGKPSYQEEAFHLSLEAPKSVSVGKEAVFKLILTAQSGYKVNDEYPLKFQFTETAGVHPAKDTVRKEDATLEKGRAEMPLPVTIQAPGKHKVSGKLSFSVCTEERCLIEKRDLSIFVDAS